MNFVISISACEHNPMLLHPAPPGSFMNHLLSNTYLCLLFFHCGQSVGLQHIVRSLSVGKKQVYIVLLEQKINFHINYITPHCWKCSFLQSEQGMWHLFGGFYFLREMTREPNPSQLARLA